MKRIITLAVIFSSFFTLFSSTTFAQEPAKQEFAQQSQEPPKQQFPIGASFDNIINEAIKDLNDARSSIQSNDDFGAFQALNSLEARLLNLTDQR